MKKLHLGSGNVYLKGYTNIDYPPSKHSVKIENPADECHDLLKLRYPANSVDEIRLHHVFEHFHRSVALALVASWQSWLRPGGILRIEVPDFERTARNVLSPFSNKKARAVGLRHIFGSNEADWAVHFEGWSAKRLKEVFQMFGLRTISVDRNQHMSTFNIDTAAKKTSNKKFNKQELTEIAERYLLQFAVDDSASELERVQLWLKQFSKQLDRTLAK